ncbi:MAG: [protein-PII] uridylyltransferase [Acidobacteriota bacterium]|nr:[protein-PII] uridylyltransferase [Acidobacteriota bacterium]
MATNQIETRSAPRWRTQGEKALLHAAERFSITGPLRDAPAISRELKTFLKIEDQRLKIAHRCGAPGIQTAAARSSVLDLVVERAYQAATLLGEIPDETNAPSDKTQSQCAVVALGGYGRGELAPYSDLDILFLYPNHRALQTRRVVEQILRLLWDAGLTVGPSFRTVSDCVTAARADPHLQTALVSTRLLAGNSAIYESLLLALEKERRKRADACIAAILRERAARYAKFGAAVCLQEPNVKESPGGIRDLHTALWVGYARYGCRTLDELRDNDVISEAERRTAARAANFLWRVRYAAHLSTRRKTERLALDLQTTLAREFGYKKDAYLLASEKFMRDYYHHARELNLFSESLLARASESERKASRRWGRKPSRTSAEPLSISNGRVQLEGEAQLLTGNPMLLFDAFALAQAADVPLSQTLRDAMRQSLPAVDRKFRLSAEASRAFMKLLGRRGRGGYVLRLMHEIGFLARFVPEFGRISLLIQHDLYHHYTVDEHTLKALEALDELYASQDKQRAHLRSIFDEIDDPSLLYLSILLHDIGKGRGRGHIPRGAKIAEGICKRLGLGELDSAKVILMVKQHVAMAQLAQRRDLNEPHVVTEFAAQMGTLDALNVLLLLTYADLNAVAPGVWSEWKNSLLWELYRRTRTVLTGTDAPPDETEKTARFKEQMAKALESSCALSEVERHVALLPDRYVRVTRPAAAAIHLHLIKELGSDIFVRRWTRYGRESTELTICARDRHGLCADIAGALAAHGIEILSAELNTREDGIALDVFMLREASTHHAIDMERYPAIERSLRKAIAGESDVAAMVERWRTRNAPRKRNAASREDLRNLPQVAGDNEASQSSTLIEVHALDEPGLAYKIASALAALGLDIVCAKIATEKSDALDVFYVTDRNGMKLSQTMMQSVKVSLAEMLSSAGGIAVTAERGQKPDRE